MQVSEVRTYVRARRPDGSRPYLDPVVSPNGKLKPGFAVINGAATRVDGSVYHLRYLKGGKRVWKCVGAEQQLALIARVKRERTLAAIAAGCW